jgi:hypothetical protein
VAVDMLKMCPDAEQFVARTAALGVEDVRESDAPPCVFVIVAGEVSDTERDTIRLLARAHWPDQRIVIAPRVAVRETGTFLKPSLGEDDGESQAS